MNHLSIAIAVASESQRVILNPGAMTTLIRQASIESLFLLATVRATLALAKRASFDLSIHLADVIGELSRSSSLSNHRVTFKEPIFQCVPGRCGNVDVTIEIDPDGAWISFDGRRMDMASLERWSDAALGAEPPHLRPDATTEETTAWIFAVYSLAAICRIQPACPVTELWARCRLAASALRRLHPREEKAIENLSPWVALGRAFCWLEPQDGTFVASLGFNVNRLSWLLPAAPWLYQIDTMAGEFARQVLSVPLEDCHDVETCIGSMDEGFGNGMSGHRNLESLMHALPIMEAADRLALFIREAPRDKVIECSRLMGFKPATRNRDEFTKPDCALSYFRM